MNPLPRLTAPDVLSSALKQDLRQFDPLDWQYTLFDTIEKVEGLAKWVSRFPRIRRITLKEPEDDDAYTAWGLEYQQIVRIVAGSLPKSIARMPSLAPVLSRAEGEEPIDLYSYVGCVWLCLYDVFVWLTRRQVDLPPPSPKSPESGSPTPRATKPTATAARPNPNPAPHPDVHLLRSLQKPISESGIESNPSHQSSRPSLNRPGSTKRWQMVHCTVVNDQSLA
jgi:hypothetical protein